MIWARQINMNQLQTLLYMPRVMYDWLLLVQEFKNWAIKLL